MEDQNLPQNNEVNDILPISLAVTELAAGCAWSLEGNGLSGLKWLDDPVLKPTNEAIIARALEIQQAIPMKRLRKERDYRLREVDWVTLRAVRTGEPIPEDWKAYMQALADITETSTPSLINGRLANVNWPARPDGKTAGLPPGSNQ